MHPPPQSQSTLPPLFIFFFWRALNHTPHTHTHTHTQPPYLQSPPLLSGTLPHLCVMHRHLRASCDTQTQNVRHLPHSREQTTTCDAQQGGGVRGVVQGPRHRPQTSGNVHQFPPQIRPHPVTSWVSTYTHTHTQRERERERGTDTQGGTAHKAASFREAQSFPSHLQRDRQTERHTEGRRRRTDAARNLLLEDTLSHSAGRLATPTHSPPCLFHTNNSLH